MTPAQQHLYRKLSEFSFDEGGEELTFASRLARENGWNVEFAERVIEEYKRFIFLAMESGHPVTPSDQVDQAWHLHLTYTKSYWNKLCGEVLGKPLHHNPTKGGQSEGLKFDDWYNKTKTSYTKYFGEPPPEDIWPDSSIRFGKDLYNQRINTKTHWIFKKPRQSTLLFGAISLTAIFAVERIIGLPSDSSSFQFADPTFIGIIVIFFLILFLAVTLKRGNKCPKCKKTNALEQTGEKTKGGFFKPAKAEWKCKFCDFVGWYPIQHASGCSPGGCSSDGGCGSGCGGCGD